jgi:CRP/FNR family transcriptional regulator, anaerobic regulatory protein
MSALDSIVERGKPLQKGQYAFRENQSFNSIFAVRSGALKVFSSTSDGREQITGFYFPGEILGLDGINNNRYESSAKALETSAICEIPFDRLGDLSAQVPSLQMQFFKLMSREISSDQQLITLLSKHTADERLATFLLSISARNARRGLSAMRFRLPMSRLDIGNYLGLTVETVSRSIGRLQKQQIIAVSTKDIHIFDLTALETVAHSKLLESKEG